MKFFSPRPQITKDRLGNTLDLGQQKSPGVVELWLACIGGVATGFVDRYLTNHNILDSPLSIRWLATTMVFIPLLLLNKFFNRFQWYCDFKRSPLLMNGTLIVICTIIFFISILIYTGRWK